MSKRLSLSLLIAAVAFAGVMMRPSTAADPANASLASRKLDIAKHAYSTMLEMQRAGRGSYNAEDVYRWSRRWLDAQREAAPDLAGRRAALVAHLDRMKEAGEIAKKRFQVGVGDQVEVLSFDYFTVEAQQLIEEADRK